LNKQNHGAGGIATMNKRQRDPLMGKEVLITGGQWKGHRGKVTLIDDRQAMVEISSVCKKLPIDRDLLKDLNEISKNKGGMTQGGEDDLYNQGGRTVYEAGKTPMQYNTGSYYPHSPHWGANSPAFGNTECNIL
jgi:transcription elongation factor